MLNNIFKNLETIMSQVDLTKVNEMKEAMDKAINSPEFQNIMSNLKNMDTRIKDNVSSIDKESLASLSKTIAKYLGIEEDFANAKYFEENIDEIIKDCERDEQPQQVSKKYLSFAEIMQATQKLVDTSDIKEQEFDTILCITRGGLVPSGILAYALGIKNIVNISVSSYNENDEQGELKISKLSKKDFEKLRNAESVLVVDDICDTGDTLVAVYDYLKEQEFSKGIDLDYFYTFTVVTKQLGYSDYYLYDMSGDDSWVVFPWDK